MVTVNDEASYGSDDKWDNEMFPDMIKNIKMVILGFDGYLIQEIVILCWLHDW